MRIWRVLWCLGLCLVLSGCGGLNPFAAGLKVGESGVVTNSAGPKVFILNDLKNYDEIAMTLTRKRDAATWDKVEKAGDVFLVANGTRVKVLEQKDSPSVSRIEVLSGPSKGKQGWVKNGYLSKT